MWKEDQYDLYAGTYLSNYSEFVNYEHV